MPPFQPNGEGARRSKRFGLCDQSGGLCGVGAVTLALLFGLFSLVYGISQVVMGVELRRTGKTVESVLQDVA